MIKLATLLEDIENAKGKLYYFAYGSNMDIAVFESSYKTAKALRLVYLPKHQLFFDKFSETDNSVVADIRENPESKVFGILYKIDASEIPTLDKQEGGYEREKVIVFDANGNKYEAYTYSVTQKSETESIPTTKYIHHIVVGLKDALDLGPVESEPIKNELGIYIKRVLALDKEAGIIG